MAHAGTMSRRDRAPRTGRVVRPTTDAAGDRGSTFIEVLIAVVLVGTVGVAVLAAMGATLRAAATHDRLATAQSRVSDAGDHLTDITLVGDTYVSCATPGSYQPEVDVWAVTVQSVEFWNGSSWGACSGAGSTQMQKISLGATVGGLTRELVVVKRKATQAGSAGGAWNDGMVSPDPNPGL